MSVEAFVLQVEVLEHLTEVQTSQVRMPHCHDNHHQGRHTLLYLTLSLQLHIARLLPGDLSALQALCLGQREALSERAWKCSLQLHLWKHLLELGVEVAVL